MKHILLSGNTAWSMYNFRAGLICNFLKAGYRVTVLAPEDRKYKSLIEKLGATFVNINIDAKGTNLITDIKLIISFKKKFKEINPDFIFLYTIKPNIYGSIAARFVGIPHIAIVTGLGYTFLNNNLVANVARLLYKQALKSTLEVWFLNKDDLHVFLSYNLVPKSKGFILKGEGIDMKRFVASNQQNNNVSFLLMARMLWDKGVGEFIEAARVLKVKYPFVEFNLLGFMGVDNPSAITREQMDLWLQEGVVNYLGSTSDVVPFVFQHSCVVLPSYREGIPVTLLEAASMCKPIVTTDSAGCRDTVEDGITGYLCKVRDVESLIRALEKIILMTPQRRQAMGEAGRKKMEREFDEEIIVKEYLEALKRNLI